MNFQDPDLTQFAAEGPPALPTPTHEGSIDHDGARIHYSAHGSGHPVLLLHGGLGHSGNWAHQVPALIAAGYRPILIDTRGHGRSTRGYSSQTKVARPFTYELLASDTLAVMDALEIPCAPIVGWSDGACTALVLAATHPARCTGVFFFACNMDPSGTKPFVATPTLDRCFARHTADFARLSPTPGDFQQLVEDLSLMQRTQPNYTADDLARIQAPVTIVHAEHDEFIRPEHARYLARSIPGADYVFLEGVSHFAPLQRPAQFNAAILNFLNKLQP